MSYQRRKSADFGSSRTGLTTVAYSLDGGESWTAAGVAEVAAGTGIYSADVTFPDGFTGDLIWKTGEASGQRFASEAVNPGSDELTDAKTSAVPGSVWSNGTRTMTAFPFSVTVGGFTGGPTFRAQDDIAAPTWDDCFASAWAAANAAEHESDTAKTWVRYHPDGVTPMRSFTLTTDANGNPVRRD